jgi:DNA-binding Lrp family transcriptional regulator
VRRVKPGAAVLLEGKSAAPDAQVVLAYQRYGAGKVLAMPVQDSWMWQMHADIPAEDLTHETLWRRLLRWLVDGVPDRVTASVDRDRVEAGDTVAVAATVRDGGFLGLNDATVVATVTGPAGGRRDVPMPFAVDRDGEYRATFEAEANGLYEVEVSAKRGDEAVGTDTAFVRAAPDDGEYFDAAMRATLLKRIAEDTGGRFYTASNAASLADDITYLGRGVTVVQEKDLWDMPIVLALLVGLVGGEWFLRRKVGLP